jgi:hypothetical protein
LVYEFPHLGPPYGANENELFVSVEVYPHCSFAVIYTFFGISGSGEFSDRSSFLTEQSIKKRDDNEYQFKSGTD